MSAVLFRSALTLAAATLIVTPAVAQSSDRLGTPISPGRTITGELSTSDPILTDQTHFDCYSVLTSPGQRIQIDQLSSAFDSYLIVGGGSCESLTSPQHNDDGGEGLNARVTIEGTGGIFYILANSVVAGATGPYQLRASLAGAAPTVTRLNVGQTVNGTLSPSDRTLPDNSHYDCFSVQTRVGQRLQIDQTSDDFDSYLSVGTGGCEQLTATARDDDGGGGLNARIVHDGDGGVLFIQANSVSAGQTGAYQLRVSQAQGRAPSPGRPPAGNAAGGPAPTPYSNVDLSTLGASRPTSLPVVTSEWGTDVNTCYAAYSAMVEMTVANVQPREWGNVSEIAWNTRRTRLGLQIDYRTPEAAMIDFSTANFKSMAMVGAIGVAPNGQPNQGRPLAEYLTALANCDRAHGLTPVTRY